jgi:hypothetical protein
MMFYGTRSYLTSYLFFIRHKIVQVGSKSGWTRAVRNLDYWILIRKSENKMVKKCFFKTVKSR